MSRRSLCRNTRKRMVVLAIASIVSFMYIRNMVLLWNTDLNKNVTMTENDGNNHNLTLFDMTAPDIFSRHIQFNLKEYGQKCDGRRFLVFVCRDKCGGWGDRLKGIISAFVFAMLTNRTFLIDMSEPCPLYTFLKPNLYDWHKCLAKVKRANFNEVLRIKFKQIDDMVLGKFDDHRILTIVSRSYVVSNIRRTTSAHKLIPWIHRFTNEEIYGSALGMLFKPSPQLSTALVTFKNENILNKRLVCSHIRYGTNPTLPKDKPLKQGTPNVSSVFEFLKSFDTMEDTAIFIATDSEEVRKKSRTLFSSFISTERRIIHVDQVKADQSESCDGFFAVLLDQLILSRCDVLVLTRSNFGVMAAYMRGESEHIYLSVKDHDNLVNAANLPDIQKIYRFI